MEAEVPRLFLSCFQIPAPRRKAGHFIVSEPHEFGVKSVVFVVSVYS